MFEIKTIRNSYFISLISIAFVLLIILTSFFIYQRYREFTDEAEIQRNDFVISQEEIIKNEVDKAIDFIEFNKAKIAGRVEAGEKYEDVKKEIQEDIVRWIQEIRFDEGGYIFVSTYEGIVLAHYRPEHIGTNLWDLTDPNGIKIHQTILKVGTRPGGGYMEYIGTKNPVTGKPGKKVTFARSIAEWRWLVGAGVYLDNIEVVIAANREQFIKRIKSHVIYAILIFLIVTALAILIINNFSQKIGKQFNLLIHHFQKSATTCEKIDREKLPYNEFKVLSDSVNKMVEERKQAQQALQKSHDELELRVKERTSELEASNKELEVFAYSVSHDLQAPLRAISGFSEILLKDYLDTLDDQGQHYLQRVRAGTVNMSQMIEDLLTLSRIGRRPINKKSVDIEELVKETYELLSETERKDRKVDFATKPCPPVSSDPQLLKIVLTNLLSNALKFTRKCKKAKIEFGFKTEDEKTIFYIKDNGIGFDMKYVDKLFGPFQRLHREEEYEGSGIGLASVQRIIHRHGGQIWAESIPGSGTTFYFTL